MITTLTPLFTHGLKDGSRASFTHGLKDSRGWKGGLMIIGHSNIILLQYYNTNSNIILLQYYYNITMYCIVTILQYYNVYYNVYNITMYSLPMG